MNNTVASAQADLDRALAMVAAAQDNITLCRRALSAAKAHAAEEARREDRRRQDRTRHAARRKAASLGLTLERDGDLTWVWPPAGRYHDEDRDPRCGQHSCVGWEEVLQAVEDYEAAFARGE